ncbi:DUF1569 domain-containing protein [Arenibacter sp. S6351L]|uniref:DUF1569 domain-containing protein n=1 Tax=Arenibacter sp. S6351L TaxID=2926407 RepID=UPI001FF6A06F|nr:DUF1569 domain-containing protein [Arenibacter sp. S6351L]MCK0134067.1 DUF1569 domain-containing protein [Arenibacter sp. S6351L]
MKNIFEKKVVDELIGRINKLTPKSTGIWGKMNVAQMLAHCNVSYEMVFTEKHPKPNGPMKLMLKLFVKQTVVNEKPYKKNSRTAPAFLIVDERDFEKEKKRLIDHLIKTQELGEDYFHNKESHSFGPLTKTEWNNLFYKHLNHHLEQFGV